MLYGLDQFSSTNVAYYCLTTAYGPSVRCGEAYKLFFEGYISDPPSLRIKSLPQLLNASFLHTRNNLLRLNRVVDFEITPNAWTKYVNCVPYGVGKFSGLTIPRNWARCELPMFCPSCWFRTVFLRMYGPVHYWAVNPAARTLLHPIQPVTIELRKLSYQYRSYPELLDATRRLRSAYRLRLLRCNIQAIAMHVSVDYDSRENEFVADIYAATVLDKLAKSKIEQAGISMVGECLGRVKPRSSPSNWARLLCRHIRYRPWWITLRKIQPEAVADALNLGYLGNVTFASNLKGVSNAHTWSRYELRHIVRGRQEWPHGNC